MEKAMIAAGLVALLLISPAAYAATSHTVGGNSGWNTNVNYDTWASAQTFVSGDSLVFNYDATHAVDEVTEPNYRTCNTANPINSEDDSPTTVSLSAPGMRYFICPRSNHCNQGMKLAVNVTAASTSPGSPSPPSSSSPSPPGTPTTPSTPPPPAGNAATTLGARNSLAIGLLLVFAAMLMG